MNNMSGKGFGEIANNAQSNKPKQKNSKNKEQNKKVKEPSEIKQDEIIIDLQPLLELSNKIKEEINKIREVYHCKELYDMEVNIKSFEDCVIKMIN